MLMRQITSLEGQKRVGVVEFQHCWRKGNEKVDIGSLIHLNRTVNTSDKGISSQEPNGTSQQEVDCTSKETVTKEEQSRDKSCNVQLEHVVPDAVGEDPEGTAASSQEALPPPVIVL